MPASIKLFGYNLSLLKEANPMASFTLDLNDVSSNIFCAPISVNQLKIGEHIISDISLKEYPSIAAVV